MPLHRTGVRRRFIKHPEVSAPFNILHPESVPGYQTGRIDPVWHTFMNPKYMTPFNMYEMDLDGITRKELEEKIKTTYQIKNVTPEMINAVSRTLPNLRIVEKVKTASSTTSSSTDSSSQETLASSSVHSSTGPHAAQKFVPSIIEHIPGTNDDMFGGGGPESTGHISDVDDSTVCSRMFINQVESMPFRILQLEDLKEMRWLFNDPVKCCDELPVGFLTTNYGLRRAFKECLAVGMQGDDWDLIMLATVTRRGGMLEDQTAGRKKVIYVEDMFPLIPEWHKLYDRDYWDELYAQGHVWREMPEIDT